MRRHAHGGKGSIKPAGGWGELAGKAVKASAKRMVHIELRPEAIIPTGLAEELGAWPPPPEAIR